MSAPSSINQSLRIPVADVALDADLGVPENPRGAVLFAHGSGSGRHSPRNRQVAAELNRAGLVTVLADLLTAEEERVDLRTTALRFDIDLLAARLTALVDWVTRNRPTAGRGIGLFGASTGAAAALIAAADRPTTVQAVVSRGGRADLAGAHLHEVQQPTLLIVGERDPLVIDLNRQAMRALRGETRLVVVLGASHLFEEPGTLQQVAHLARDWFVGRLEPAPADRNAGCPADHRHGGLEASPPDMGSATDHPPRSG
jgi:putative phosphoribosyl transferase